MKVSSIQSYVTNTLLDCGTVSSNILCFNSHSVVSSSFVVAIVQDCMTVLSILWCCNRHSVRFITMSSIIRCCNSHNVRLRDSAQYPLVL